MLIPTRGFRWLLFFVACISFCYVVWVRHSPWIAAVFFVSGGLWYWLERRKMHELDAYRLQPRKKSD